MPPEMELTPKSIVKGQNELRGNEVTASGFMKGPALHAAFGEADLLWWALGLPSTSFSCDPGSSPSQLSRHAIRPSHRLHDDVSCQPYARAEVLNHMILLVAAFPERIAG